MLGPLFLAAEFLLQVAQGALQYRAYVADALFVDLACDGFECGLDQTLGRTSNLGRLRIKGAAPVAPSAGPPPDVPHRFLAPFQFLLPGRRDAIDAPALLHV